jgi:TolB protein
LLKKQLFLLIFLLFKSNNAERIDLESYTSGFDSIPIAVVKFRPLNKVELKINFPWRIIADDLEFTGRFKVSHYLTYDSLELAKKQIGIFIDGEYAIEGDDIILDCYFHDAATMDLIAGKRYRGPIKYIRRMVHRYSNTIFDMLLGEKGPFESKIIYVEDRGRKKNLIVMDYDGYNQRMIQKKGTVNLFPAFLDSNNILWTSYLRGKPDIYRGAIYNNSFSILLYSRYIETSPSVSPVINKIAYASSKGGNLDIYICDFDGKNRKQLTFNQGIDTSPCWSPNGYHLAFTSDRSGQPQIYIMDVEGANIRRITFEGAYQDSPAWSPKGDLIAYSSLRNGKFDIWVIRPDGAYARQVTTKSGNNEYPTWSPDGSHIAFASGWGGKSNIYCIQPDGTRLKQITQSGKAKMPDWSSF